jgi:predicted MFS family arabinose efflux permease
VGAAAAARTPQAEPPRDAVGRVFWIPVLALAGLTLARLPETLILLRLQDLGIPLLVIPVLWAALHVVRSGSSYPGGAFTDRIGSRWMVAGGGLLFAVVAALLGLRLAPVVAGAVFLLFGVVAGLTESAERAMVARLSPRLTGRAFGAYHALVGLAALPAGLLFGEVYDRLGGHSAFWLSAIAAVVGVAVWLGAYRGD